ncbi:MAG: hypothetical protein HXX15_04445 [Rhodopseudomonas sp.]|uniref:hypothetical protein n=1 Tax=Rhodopseudomonas sp. TaxID=1078 RepID=UPI00185DBF91|nr:hypothetical protein [Rhodopseudomonas sp.]NVN85321.1 hypothetical protein [Rhodopseudomonas sp.]
MKLIGWVLSAGLVAATTAATAQALPPYQIGMAPYRSVSDFRGPYAAMPPEARQPRYLADDEAPGLLPLQEVYGVLRDNGYSPLGIPRRRGAFYSIAAINLDGDDGRLVIDARDGRIVRFVPAYLVDDAAIDEVTAGYGPQVLLPRMPRIGQAPRPPRPVPHLASRSPSVPLPKAPPYAVAAPKGDAKTDVKTGAIQSAAPIQPAPAVAAQAKTTGTAAAPSVAPPVEAKPSPPIAPTEAMPPVQGLE